MMPVVDQPTESAIKGRRFRRGVGARLNAILERMDEQDELLRQLLERLSNGNGHDDPEQSKARQ